MFYHRIRNLDRSNLSSFSYLLASTNTLTLPGPEVNMAARINQPKITFTKRSSILTATIISLLRVLVLIRQQRNRFQTQKWISGELWGALVSGLTRQGKVTVSCLPKNLHQSFSFVFSSDF